MLIKNCEIHYPKLNPTRPNTHFSKERPTWEVQLRTTDKAQAKDWREKGLKVKLHEDDETGDTYYKVTLTKRSVKADGTKAEPVRVINGALQPIDPDSIANGSIANITIYQYESTNSETGVKSTVSMLTGVQITKHIIRKKSERKDEFEESPYEAILPEGVDPVAAFEAQQDDDLPFDIE